MYMIFLPLCAPLIMTEKLNNLKNSNNQLQLLKLKFDVIIMRLKHIQ